MVLNEVKIIKIDYMIKYNVKNTLKLKLSVYAQKLERIHEFVHV